MSLTCPRIVALLSDYVDKRLPADICRELDAHIRDCPSCSKFLSSFESTVDLLRSLSEEDLPDALRLKLKACLDRRSAN